MSVESRWLVAEALFPSQPSVVYNTQPETTLHPFTVYELLVASEKLKAKKYPGVDCIPTEILKIAVTEAPDIFLKDCNFALATGCLPTRFRRYMRSVSFCTPRHDTQPGSHPWCPFCLTDH
nr:unnamed protein product [Callosobruchus analis]